MIVRLLSSPQTSPEDSKLWRSFVRLDLMWWIRFVLFTSFGFLSNQRSSHLFLPLCILWPRLCNEELNDVNDRIKLLFMREVEMVWWCHYGDWWSSSEATRGWKMLMDELQLNELVLKTLFYLLMTSPVTQLTRKSSKFGSRNVLSLADGINKPITAKRRCKVHDELTRVQILEVVSRFTNEALTRLRYLASF